MIPAVPGEFKCRVQLRSWESPACAHSCQQTSPQRAPLIPWRTICPDGTTEQGRGSWKNTAHPGFAPSSWGPFTFAHYFFCPCPSSLSRLGRCCPGRRRSLMLKDTPVSMDRTQGAGQRTWGTQLPFAPWSEMDKTHSCVKDSHPPAPPPHPSTHTPRGFSQAL